MWLCKASFGGFFLEQQLLIVLERFGFEFWILNKIWRLGRCSIAAAVWHWLTAEEALAVLVAADVIAVRQWWLKERWLVLACRLVKMTAKCLSD